MRRHESETSPTGSVSNHFVPSRFVAFGTYPNELQAGIVLAVLEEAGIRAFVQPSDAMPGSVGIFGTLSLVPSSVMVTPEDLTRAAAALEEASIDVSPEELEAAAMAGGEGERGHLGAEDEASTNPHRFSRKRSMMRSVGWIVVVVVMLALLLAVIGGGLSVIGHLLSGESEVATGVEW